MSDVTYDKSMLQEAADEILYAPDLLMHIFERTRARCSSATSMGELCLLIRSLELLSGYHRSELKGQDVDVLVPQSVKDDHIEHRRNLYGRSAFEADGTWPGLEIATEKQDGGLGGN
jgi:hypothetical protein